MKKIDAEKRNRVNESVKHISTLATGSIVLMATFLDKLAKPLVAQEWLVTAIGSLLICVLTSGLLVIFFGLGSFWRDPDETGPGFYSMLALVIYASFGTGIFSVAAYAIKNLSR